MSWKRIVVLIAILAALIISIQVVNHKEKQKEAKEGRLFTMTAGNVFRIEIDRGEKRFVFIRNSGQWDLLEPIKTRADRTMVENILDEFASLKYDREVEKNASDLKTYGLDTPQIQVKLFEKDQEKPSVILQIGITNKIDSSSYAKLATQNNVVLIPSYRRSILEKELFAYRDKRFLALDGTGVTGLSYIMEGAAFSFQKKENRWMMEKPVFSVADENKISDIVNCASSLEAKNFRDKTTEDKLKQYGFDQPLLEAIFSTAGKTKKLIVIKKDDKYFAYTPDFAEICEIEKDFAEKFLKEVNALRSHKVAAFFAFDCQEMRFIGPQLQFQMKKDKESKWNLTQPSVKDPLDNEKVNNLLLALEELNAVDFIDLPQKKANFPYSIQLFLSSPSTPKKIEIQLSDIQEDAVIARSVSLPYSFKISKDIIDKLPKKIEDMLITPPEPGKKPL